MAMEYSGTLNNRIGVQSRSQAALPSDLLSILKIGDTNMEYLGTLAERLRNLADMICGSIPRDAGTGEGGVLGNGLVDRLATHFRAESDIASDISSELGRIEVRLGLNTIPTPNAGNGSSRLGG